MEVEDSMDTVLNEGDVVMEDEAGGLHVDVDSGNMSESTLDDDGDDGDDDGRDDDAAYVPEEGVDVLKAQWSEATVQTPEMAEL